MEKNKFIAIKLFLIFLVVVIGISFVYASETSNLKIKGYAPMSSVKWDIHFQNLSNATLIGNASEISKPFINNNSTHLGNFNVTFANSNDGIVYTFDVINNGNLDAKISSITISKPVCKGKNISAIEDSNLVCNNINYSLTYSNGQKIGIGDVLKTKEKKSLVLKLEYIGSSLPKDIVEISDLNITLIYTQN